MKPAPAGIIKVDVAVFGVYFLPDDVFVVAIEYDIGYYAIALLELLVLWVT